jgi:hypothetical protein
MLSNRKLKSFDRQGGAYLALSWPAGLDPPADAERLGLDGERPATQREHIAAMRLVAGTAREYGLIHIATQVAILTRPSGQARTGQTEPTLLVHLVSPRYQRVTEPGAAAPTLWPEQQRS